MIFFLVFGDFTFNLSLIAQTSFITESNLSLGDLTPSQNERLQKILLQETTVSSTFVDVADISNGQENGWLTLQLPNKDCVAQIIPKHVSLHENGDFFWHGEVFMEDSATEEDFQCYEGSVSIMKRNSEMIATISLDDDKYEIQSLGEGITILVEKDVTGLNLSCGNDYSEDQIIDDDHNLDSRNTRNCPVRVLALFTQNGEDAVSNIQNTIELSIEQTNMAFRNSKVTEFDLELVLVDIMEIEFSETDNIGDDLDRLINNIGGAQTLRDAVDADIVVVYADGDYGSVIGQAGTLFLDDARAISLVEAAQANSEYTTAHEIAHLFACRHEPAITDPPGQFEHAHLFGTGWFSLKKRNTIMFSQVTGGTVQHFSNPNVRYRRKSTGIKDSRENWRQLRANACTVADFRDDMTIPPLSANVVGDLEACPCGAAQLNADIDGGVPGPYQIEWRISTNGFNYGNVISNNTSIFLPVSCEVGSFIFVWLSVTSADGQVSQSFAQVVVSEIACGTDGLNLANRSNTHSNAVDADVFPNPVNDILNIDFKERIQENSTLMIKDIHGRILWEQNFMNSINQQIDVSRFSSGVYLLELDGELFSKFIKS